MLGGNALASMLTRGHPNNLCSIFGDNADKNLTELSIVNLEWKLGEWRYERSNGYKKGETRTRQWAVGQRLGWLSRRRPKPL